LFIGTGTYVSLPPSPAKYGGKYEKGAGKKEDNVKEHGRVRGKDENDTAQS
jgi:hypothetical protein